MFHISWYEQDDILKINIFSQQWYNQKCIWRNCFITEYKILSREKIGIWIQNILKRIDPNCFFQGFKTWLRRTLTFGPTKKMYALHIKRQTYKKYILIQNAEWSYIKGHYIQCNLIWNLQGFISLPLRFIILSDFNYLLSNILNSYLLHYIFIWNLYKSTSSSNVSLKYVWISNLMFLCSCSKLILKLQ